MNNSNFTTVGCLLLVLLLNGMLAAQSLSPTEQRIVASVKANHDDAVAMLERVVNINSGTLNLVGVKEVGSVFGAAFQEIGFSARLIPIASTPQALSRYIQFPAPDPTAGKQSANGKKLAGSPLTWANRAD